SVGFTKPVRKALRQSADAKDHFFDDVAELVSYLDDTAIVTAYPQDHGRTDLYILTGGGSAEFSAKHGMGLVLGGPAVTRGLEQREERSPAVQQYRQHFARSALRDQSPYRSEEHTLNSSHVSISYAVFCLKKKKQTPR